VIRFIADLCSCIYLFFGIIIYDLFCGLIVKVFAFAAGVGDKFN